MIRMLIQFLRVRTLNRVPRTWLRYSLNGPFIAVCQLGVMSSFSSLILGILLFVIHGLIWPWLIVMRVHVSSLARILPRVAKSLYLLRILSRIGLREVTLCLEVLIHARRSSPLRVQIKLPTS